MVQLKQTHTKFVSITCSTIIPAALIFLFAYTGIAKLLGHPAFLHQLYRMDMLKPYATMISYCIPGLEIIAACLLAIPSGRTAGLLLSALLMLLFTTFVAVTLAGKHLPCSCGGVISKMNWQQHLFFNITFTLLSITALWYQRSLHVYKRE